MFNELRGGLLVLLAAFFWGCSGVVGKLLNNLDVAPMSLLQISMLFSLVVLFLFMFLFHRQELKIRLRDIPYLIIYGISAFSLVQYFFYLTINLTNVGTTVFLLYLSPILVAVFSAVFLHEQMTGVKVIAIFMATLGTFLIITNQPSGLRLNSLGLATGLLAAAIMAFSTLWSKRGTSRFQAWTMLFYGILFGSVFLAVLNPPWNLAFHSYSGEVWFFLAFLAVFNTIVPYWLYLLGLKYLSPTKVIILATFETVAASALAYIFLRETMSLLQACGSAMILAGIIAVQLQRET